MDETQPLPPAQPHDPAPTSGNRWEPGTTALADPSPHTAYDATWAAAAPLPPATAPTETTPRRSLRDRARAVPSGALAAIGAALIVIAVAIGGFVVGRTTAPEGTTTQQPGTGTTDQGGFPGRPYGDGGRQGFPGGTLPGQGTGTGTGTNS